MLEIYSSIDTKQAKSFWRARNNRLLFGFGFYRHAIGQPWFTRPEAIKVISSALPGVEINGGNYSNSFIKPHVELGLLETKPSEPGDKGKFSPQKYARLTERGRGYIIGCAVELMRTNRHNMHSLFEVPEIAEGLIINGEIVNHLVDQVQATPLAIPDTVASLTGVRLPVQHTAEPKV